MPASRVRTSLQGSSSHHSSSSTRAQCAAARATRVLKCAAAVHMHVTAVPPRLRARERHTSQRQVHLQRSPSAAMRASASSRRLPFSTPLVTSGMGMSRWMRYTRTQGGTSDRILRLAGVEA